MLTFKDYSQNVLTPAMLNHLGLPDTKAGRETLDATADIAVNGLQVGVTYSIDGVTYIVTETGVRRLTGSRKERRAKRAKIRTEVK